MKIDNKVLEFLNGLTYWHKDEVRELYKAKGYDAMMKYLETLVTYRVRVLGETLDEISGGTRAAFWDKYKSQ